MALIILLRHAKVSINSSLLFPHSLGSYIKSYNSASIKEFSLDEDLKKLVENSDIFISSNLKRTQKTLELLGQKAAFSSELFDEVSLPYPNLKTPIKFPVSFLLILFRVAWILGYKTNATSLKKEQKRATLAAKRLLEFSKNNNKVTLVGHGIFNFLIAKQLIKLGAKKVSNSSFNYIILEGA